MSRNELEVSPAGRGSQDQNSKCSCGRALLPHQIVLPGAKGPPFPHPYPSIAEIGQYQWQDASGNAGGLWCGDGAGLIDQRTPCESVLVSAANSNSISSSSCCARCELARTANFVRLDHRRGYGHQDESVYSSSCGDNTSDCGSSSIVTQLEGGCAEDVEHCCIQAGAGCRAGRTTFALIVTTWLRLGSLLVALLAVTVQGAPTAMSLHSRRLSSEPKWLNPCGFAAEEFDSDLDVVQLNDETLLGNIVMQAKTALHQANSFRDDYIKRTFGSDYLAHHKLWRGNHYDWLPNSKQIPKSLGEQLDQEFLDKLEVRMIDTALLDAYEFMQRYAVGLEQIVWDQDDHKLAYLGKFQHSENLLRSVLCELQMALAERGVTPRADVTREVMPQEYRDMSESATYRNLRDWLIFRDYMNGLEFIVQVFEHLVRGIQS